MINQQEFAERLSKIMSHYDITAANFATRIAVQRSSISHILSGRNKPSLEFVMKVLKEFPEVELYWLLNGTGSFPKVSTAPTPIVTVESAPATDSKDAKTIKESLLPTNDSEYQDIERIVIFYRDGSFKAYTP